jgi:hypothetical protein
VDPGFAIGVGVLWVILNLLGRRKRSSDPRAQSPAARPQVRPPTTLPRSTGADPTQREGARLQDLLRELGKTLDEAAGPRGRPSSVRLPPAEEVEERASLETVREAQSLEQDVRRPERKVVDADDEAEVIAARRIAAAEANARPLGAADHQAFDAQIRGEAADATATRASNVAQLRQAVIWREILGPPVSERQ